MSKLELVIGNYNPETDYEGVIECLQPLGFFQEDQDTPDRMRTIVEDTPSAIRVARFAGQSSIEACMHIPNSIVPLIFRQGVHPYSHYQTEVGNAMINDASRILREGGVRQIEDLIDVDWPLPNPSESRALTDAAARGFAPAYSLVSVKRELWLPDGQPVPDLPTGDAFTVAYQ